MPRRRTRLLILALTGGLLISCGGEDPPLRFTTTGMDYDSVLAYLITEERPDTGTPRLLTAYLLTMVLKNKSGRPLSIDSAYNGTLLTVVSDSTRSRVWASPPSFTDTTGRRVPLPAGDSLLHAGLWRPTAFETPLPAGDYTAEGWICGFRTDGRRLSLR